MSESSRFAKNYFAIVLGFAVNIGLNAATMLLLGWGLSVGEFGVFSYALAIVGILSVVGQAGTSQYSVSFIPRNKHLIGDFLSAAQGLRVAAILPMLLAVVILALVTCTTTAGKETVIIMGLAMIIQLELFFIRDVFQAVEMNYLGSILLTVRACSLLAGIGIWYMAFHGPWIKLPEDSNRDLLGLAIIWVVTQVPAVILAMRMIGRRVAPLKIDWRPASWWWILKKSYLFALVSLVMVQPGTVETIILKVLKGSKNNDELGYYQVSLRLAMLTMLLAVSVSEAFRPIISRKFGESPAAFRRAIHSLHKYSFLTGVPIFLFTAVFAHDILGMLFGTKYLPATPLVQMICLANIINVTPPLWMVFHMTDLQHLSFRIGLVNLGVTVILCIILYPHIGMYGAAIATSATIVVSKLQTILYWRRHGYPMINSLLPLVSTLAVSILATGGSWLLLPYLHLAATFACFAVAVLVGTWTLAMDSSDRRAAIGVLSRAAKSRRNQAVDTLTPKESEQAEVP